MPTMIRNDQKMTATGGQFSRGTVSSPFSGASSECFRMRDEAFGISMEYFILPAAWSGNPNRMSGAPFGWLVKWPSIAITFTG